MILFVTSKFEIVTSHLGEPRVDFLNSTIRSHLELETLYMEFHFGAKWDPERKCHVYNICCFFAPSQEYSTLTAISDAVHSLAIMTTRTNAFEMLQCIVDCCKHSMEAVGEGNGTDELLPVIIYVVLKVSLLTFVAPTHFTERRRVMRMSFNGV